MCLKKNIFKEMVEDTKGIIRNRKLKRTDNAMAKKNKRTNNDLQHITHKSQDRATRFKKKNILLNNNSEL